MAQKSSKREKKDVKSKKESLASERITLYIPSGIILKLKQDMEKYSYVNLQEAILGALRDNYFRNKKTEIGSKRGRPQEKLDVHKILSTPITKGRPSEPWI